MSSHFMSLCLYGFYTSSVVIHLRHLIVFVNELTLLNATNNCCKCGSLSKTHGLIICLICWFVNHLALMSVTAATSTKKPEILKSCRDLFCREVCTEYVLVVSSSTYVVYVGTFQISAKQNQKASKAKASNHNS